MGAEPLINIKSDKDIVWQIQEAKKILQERLGRQIDAFSYPEGMFNNKIRQIVVDSGFKVAVATNPGRQYPNDDIFALKRLRISSASNNLIAFWIKTAGYYKFFKERNKR
jgi:alpha-amylase/alpha-mannosidase (GH57 family)